MSDEGRYLWCKASVDLLMDTCVFTYQVAGLEVQGSDSFEEENLSNWSDDDIRQIAHDLLGVPKELVEIIYT